MLDFLAFTKQRIKALRAEADWLESTVIEFERKGAQRDLAFYFGEQHKAGAWMGEIHAGRAMRHRYGRDILVDLQNKQRAAFAEIKRLRGDAE